MDTIIRDTIVHVRRLLDDTDWIQGSAFEFSDEGQVTGMCLVAATSIAAQQIAPDYAEIVSEGALHALRAGLNDYDLVEWNDTEGRTLADVFGALDLALVALKP